jgi:hypothetical protein
MLAIQHNELIKSDSIKLKSVDSSDQFFRLIESLSKVYKSRDATEKTITESLSTLSRYLQIFND